MRQKILAAVLILPLSAALSGASALADGVSKSSTTNRSNGAGNVRGFDAQGDSLHLKTANFISAHGQCRYVRNDSGKPALYVPLKRADEWQRFYQTEGGDKAYILVCCQPVTREICGQNVSINFMVVGDHTTLEAGHDKKIVYRCAANSNVVKQSESGQCEAPSSGNSGGPDHPGGDRNGDGSIDGADNGGGDPSPGEGGWG